MIDKVKYYTNGTEEELGLCSMNKNDKGVKAVIEGWLE